LKAGSGTMKRFASPKRLLLGLLVAAALVVGGLFVADQVRSSSETKKIDAPPGEKIYKTDAEWREILTPEQYRVTRMKGTERSCSGVGWNSKDDGVYQCVCCGLPLFDSVAKYESGTGWPSFNQPVEKGNVAEVLDNSMWMRRTEVVCRRCDAHLGHVFTDGPPPSGLRYCMNSAAMKFVPRGKK
jgi:peptide-methionine (R)-S-oxide reductase